MYHDEPLDAYPKGEIFVGENRSSIVIVKVKKKVKHFLINFPKEIDKNLFLMFLNINHCL